jgi:hypothetical protein
MILKRNILTLLRCIGINLLLLLAAAVGDIILFALLLRFSSHALTIACFAVAGTFSAVFCFSPAESVAYQKKEWMARNLLIIIIAFCILLLFVIAPLSGWDYNWPVKFFAIAEVATAGFLWKNKLYSNTGTPGSKV